MFALAPQPLLFKLGVFTLRSIKCSCLPVPHREGDKWAWPDDQSTVDFQIHQSKADSETAVALVIDLRVLKLLIKRIENTLGERCSIYHLTIPEPNRVFVKNPQIQDSFVRTFRLAMERIKNDNLRQRKSAYFQLCQHRLQFVRVWILCPRWICQLKSMINFHRKTVLKKL